MSTEVVDIALAYVDKVANAEDRFTTRKVYREPIAEAWCIEWVRGAYVMVGVAE